MEAPTIGTLPAGTIGFTLSPKPRKVLNNKHLFRWWVIHIHKLLKMFSKDYTYYPELDSSGRLHFHGWITPYDKIKFKRCSNVLRRLGFVKFEPSLRNNGTNWKNYCSKDVAETVKVFADVHVENIPVTPATYHEVLSELDAEKDLIDATWFSKNLQIT